LVFEGNLCQDGSFTIFDPTQVSPAQFVFFDNPIKVSFATLSSLPLSKNVAQ
jgi:hypothetical protein